MSNGATTANCSNCKFIWSDSTCRAHPPSAVGAPTSAAWGWPIVTADDWCGEFQQGVNPSSPPPQISGPPVSITAPVVTGAAAQPAICTCSQGVWSADAISFAYQWMSGSTAVVGATSNYYQSSPADVGKLVTCTVTASNSFGAATATSNALGPIS